MLFSTCFIGKEVCIATDKKDLPWNWGEFVSLRTSDVRIVAMFIYAQKLTVRVLLGKGCLITTTLGTCKPSIAGKQETVSQLRDTCLDN